MRKITRLSSLPELASRVTAFTAREIFTERDLVVVARRTSHLLAGRAMHYRYGHIHLSANLVVTRIAIEARVFRMAEIPGITGFEAFISLFPPGR